MVNNMAIVKHKVKGNKEVIYNGVIYTPDKDGVVSLPGTLETKDVTPEKPKKGGDKDPGNKDDSDPDNNGGDGDKT